MQIPCVQQVQSNMTFRDRIYSNRMQRMRPHGPQKRYERRVSNTSAPIAKARSTRRAITERTALECKPRFATNAVNSATARTNARFSRSVHVAFKLTNYKPASYVMSIPRHYMFTMKCDSAWPFVSSDLG